MLLRTIMARRLGALNDSSVRAHRFGERRAHSSQLGLQRLRLGGGLIGEQARHAPQAQGLCATLGAKVGGACRAERTGEALSHAVLHGRPTGRYQRRALGWDKNDRRSMLRCARTAA